MKINIYTKFNGVGLEADARIIKGILTPEHDVEIINWNKPMKRNAKVGIHLEHIRRELLHLASYNVSIPNPEWFDEPWRPLLRHVQAVWCKTDYTLSIFQNLHQNCIKTGFTSEDKCDATVEKHKIFIHMAGRSSHKGSETIRDIWKSDKSLPLLLLQKIEHLNGFQFQLPNYYCQNKRLVDIKEFLNQAIFHLCPSKAEGFGHYINEALSTGAIVITTDHGPMNELVTTDYGFIVPGRVCGRHRLAEEYCVDPKALKEAVVKAYSLDNDTLLQMSAKAREAYLKRDAEFRTKLKTLINNIV